MGAVDLLLCVPAPAAPHRYCKEVGRGPPAATLPGPRTLKSPVPRFPSSPVHVAGAQSSMASLPRVSKTSVFAVASESGVQATGRRGDEAAPARVNEILNSARYLLESHTVLLPHARPVLHCGLCHQRLPILTVSLLYKHPLTRSCKAWIVPIDVYFASNFTSSNLKSYVLYLHGSWTE